MDSFAVSILMFWVKIMLYLVHMCIIGELHQLLPVTSAAIKPSALMTFTWRNPTSFMLLNILSGLWKTQTCALGKET